MSYSLDTLENYMKQNSLARLEIELDDNGNSRFIMFNNEGEVKKVIKEQRFTQQFLTLTAL